jgi:ribosomal protein L24
MISNTSPHQLAYVASYFDPAKLPAEYVSWLAGLKSGDLVSVVTGQSSGDVYEVADVRDTWVRVYTEYGGTRSFCRKTGFYDPKNPEPTDKRLEQPTAQHIENYLRHKKKEKISKKESRIKDIKQDISDHINDLQKLKQAADVASSLLPYFSEHGQAAFKNFVDEKEVAVSKRIAWIEELFLRQETEQKELEALTNADSAI